MAGLHTHLLSEAEYELQLEKWESFYRGPRVIAEIIFTSKHRVVTPVAVILVQVAAPYKFHNCLCSKYIAPRRSRLLRNAEHHGRPRETGLESANAGCPYCL